MGGRSVGEPLVQLNGGRFGSAEERESANGRGGRPEVHTAETQKACRQRRKRWKVHQRDDEEKIPNLNQQLLSRAAAAGILPTTREGGKVSLAKEKSDQPAPKVERPYAQ